MPIVEFGCFPVPGFDLVDQNSIFESGFMNCDSQVTRKGSRHHFKEACMSSVSQ